MEIHIQKCQNCRSRNLRNILVRDQVQMVYIQCRDCEQLVARYVLAKGGYFHAGKGFESFLRSVERDGDFASARDINSTYDEIEAQIQAEFDTLTEKVTTLYKGKLP